MIRPLSLSLLLATALLGQQSAGLADYRAGRWQAAYTALAAELATAGAAASAELRWNTALAALRLQRCGDAEAAIAPLQHSERADERADAEFLLAMCQHQRGELAAAAAQLPDAEPMAWPSALRALQQALAGFLRADAVRDGWPEARRNAERCQRRLAELERLRDQQQEQKARQEKAPPPAEPPKPKQPPEPEPAAPAPVLDRLSPAELAALLQRGQLRDRKKRQDRQAAAAQGPVVGERDW